MPLAPSFLGTNIMLALGKLHAPTLGTTIYIGTMFAQRHIPPHPKALPESPEGTSSPTRSVRTTRLLRADEAGCAFSQGYSGSPTSGASTAGFSIAGAVASPLFRMMFTTVTASVMDTLPSALTSPCFMVIVVVATSES